MKDNPVFGVFAALIILMMLYGFWMESRLSRLEVQTDRIERIQRGD